MSEKQQQTIAAALKVLGIRNLLCGIQDSAFPSLPEEETGRGTPYSKGAADFLRFTRSLGFSGIQLGPQGMTSRTNSSPYDATLFSRNPLSLSISRLLELDNRLFQAKPLFTAPGPSIASGDRVNTQHAWQAMDRFLADLGRRFHEENEDIPKIFPGAWQESFRRFRKRNAGWLERDALYEVLRNLNGGRYWRHWSSGAEPVPDRSLYGPAAGEEQAAAMRRKTLLTRHRQEISWYCFVQFLLYEQHQQFMKRMRSLGLKLFGDLQIGFSGRDAWYAQSFLLTGYVMGAPPSRTNPEGQPWNYPVLDPRQYYSKTGKGRRSLGPSLVFLRERLAKLCCEYDGLRIDHPHGLVCPWVYRSGQPDPVAAVQRGARLFASPGLDDHPELSLFAIPRPDQLDTSKNRYDDNWIRQLEPDQVECYGAQFEVIIGLAGDNGRNIHDIACEILSTQPYPIKKVMDLYGLGRFRITQKANLDNPEDVYRSENAAMEDWIMLGNHDTPTIWQMEEKWRSEGTAEQQAAYLAGRLNIPARERSGWVKRVAAAPGELAQAKCADLFCGPAANVMIFFTDLLGMKEQYNCPGCIGEENWSLRIAPGYRQRYGAMAAQNRALNIPAALVLALRAKTGHDAPEYRRLLRELEAAAMHPGI